MPRRVDPPRVPCPKCGIPVLDVAAEAGQRKKSPMFLDPTPKPEGPWELRQEFSPVIGDFRWVAFRLSPGRRGDTRYVAHSTTCAGGWKRRLRKA